MSISRKKKILIGCCGGLTGIFLSKYFAKKENYIIYGFDNSSLSAGEIFVDRFYQLPHSNSESFIDSLINLINSEKIEYYFPTHSKEICKISEFEDRLREQTNVKFIVCPKKTFDMLDNKKQAYYNLALAGIPTPRIITEPPLSYPVVMKEYFGSGGSGVQIINNEKVYFAYRDTATEVCFFEHINGREFTADCVFDNNGKLLFYNLRERVKTIGGAVVIAKNTYDFDISPWLKQLENSFDFLGCVNFQFIVKENIPYLIDVNLRYPSGGLPLTVQTGIDVPDILLRLMDGEKIAEDDYPINKKVRVMYRYYEEVYGYDNIT